MEYKMKEDGTAGVPSPFIAVFIDYLNFYLIYSALSGV